METVGGTVGYHIRLKSKYSDNTKILFCTTGILLRRLQQPGFLRQVSHIIIDEVHERQVRLFDRGIDHPFVQCLMLWCV